MIKSTYSFCVLIALMSACSLKSFEQKQIENPIPYDTKYNQFGYRGQIVNAFDSAKSIELSKDWLEREGWERMDSATSAIKSKGVFTLKIPLETPVSVQKKYTILFSISLAQMGKNTDYAFYAIQIAQPDKASFQKVSLESFLQHYKQENGTSGVLMHHITTLMSSIHKQMLEYENALTSALK